MFTSSSEHDFVVVGAGAAGAVLATRLAEAGADVCLLEAGPSDLSVPAVRDVRQWETLLGSAIDFDYELQLNEGINPNLRYSAGRVLGGSSSINTSFAFQPPAGDLELWEASGARGWRPTDIAPYVDRVRERVHVERPRAPHPTSRRFIEAALQAGWSLVEHGGTELREGAGWMPLSAKGTARQSTAESYLRHPQGLPTLEIRLETPARRVVIDGGSAIGVEVGDQLIRARQEVILCAGALATPKLLMLSGIGDSSQLRSHAIPVVVDRPEVGQNLADHPLSGLTWRTRRTTQRPEVLPWEAGLIARSSYSESAPDLFIACSTTPFEFEAGPDGPIPEDRGMTVAVFLTRADSAGDVRLASADPADPPLIRPGYFTDPRGRDIKRLAAGLEIARRLVGQPAFEGVVKQDASPASGLTGKHLEAYIRRSIQTMFHPAGTCRMGADTDAVVAPDLRVNGVDGLRVADASVFPAMVRVTPNLTCMAIGERAADLVLQDADK